MYSSLHAGLAGFFSYLLLNYDRPDRFQNGLVIGLIIVISEHISLFIKVRNYDNIVDDKHLRWVSDNLTELLICTIFCFLFLMMSVKTESILPIRMLGLIAIGVLYLFLGTKPYLNNILIAKSWTFTMGLFGGEFNYLFIYFLSIHLWYDLKGDSVMDNIKIASFFMSLIMAALIMKNHWPPHSYCIPVIVLLHAIMFFITVRVSDEKLYLLIPESMIVMTALGYYFLLNS